MLATMARCSFVALLGLMLVVVGCESRVSLGSRCTSDTECGALRCDFGRCRAQCARASDCADPAALCLAQAGGGGVCTVPSVDRCSTDCTTVGLVCDGELCTTPCTSTCLEGATCDVSSNVCVSVSRPPNDAGTTEAGTMDAGTMDAGTTDAGTTDAGTGSAVVDFCIGTFHACVVDAPDGTVRCWGVGHAGELGGGAALVPGAPDTIDCMAQNAGDPCTSTFTPRMVVDARGPLRDVVAIVCGERVTLALTRGGQLHSWGVGSGGELGRAYPPENNFDPVAAPVTDRADVALSGVSGAAMGSRHGCAWTADRTFCWGAHYAVPAGQLGDGVDPELVAGAVEATVLGPSGGAAMADVSTCALGSDGVRCVGLNELGAVGDTTRLDTVVRSPANLVQFTGVSGPPSTIVAGPQFYCALFGTTPACWGQAVEGTLGRGDVSRYAERCPDGASLCDARGEPVSGRLAFDAIASGPGASTVCGTSGGRVYCWGSSERGEAGSTTRVPSPRDPVLDDTGATLEGVRAVRVGGHTACALTHDDRLFCWGSNQWGHFRTMLDPRPDPAAVQHVRAVQVPLD